MIDSAPSGSLRETIARTLDAAAADGDEAAQSVLRLIKCAVKDRDIAAGAGDRGRRCPDEEIVDILSQMRDQRIESAKAFEDSGRIDSAERERRELAVIEGLLPDQMGEDEIRAAAAAVVRELDARGLRDVGRCMGALKRRYLGRMDFTKAGAAVRDQLV